MRKNRFVAKDSDYLQDGEDAIKLDFCAEGGNNCRSQMAFMNENLVFARKLFENKEFTRGIEAVKIAFDSTFELKENQCQGCANLFRTSITHSLDQVIKDLEEMTKGFLGSKKFVADIDRAKKTLQELKETSNKNLLGDK